ncbi:hypothetical protein [Streptomyces sp. NPDC051997]|uniref:hypothetical protein n=1 Tax=Streptomyces sp. NPDC051997 TaxID=3155611 RepID=UPI003434BDAF
MSTDIHGSIEFPHPGTGTDYDDGEPWVAAIDLRPLYDETDCHGRDVAGTGDCLLPASDLLRQIEQRAEKIDGHVS